MSIYKKYKLERDMCNELILHAKKNGWTVYPEQGGWDILLIRNNIQVGVQAKLRPNIKLLSQAIVHPDLPGPHYRAVAIGNSHWKEKDDFKKIADGLRLVLIDMGVHPKYWVNIQGSLKYYRHFPKSVLWLPPFIPELDAGIPAPKTVSPWMVASVKLQFLFEEKGWVSIIDAREIVSQELPKGYSDSYPRTLLQTYFRCTNERDPRNSRCKKWVPKTKPSKKFARVFEGLKGEKDA